MSRLLSAAASLLLLLEAPASLADCLGIERDQWTGRCVAPTEQAARDVCECQGADSPLGPPAAPAGASTLQQAACSVYGPKGRSCSLGFSRTTREEGCSHRSSQVLYGEQTPINTEDILQSQEDIRSSLHRIWEDMRESESGMSCHSEKKDKMTIFFEIFSKTINCTSERNCECVEEVVLAAWRSGTSRSSLLNWVQDSSLFNQSVKCGGGYLKGFYFDVSSEMWLDVDECREGTSGCAHECENTIGSYRCKCRPGYFLQEDQRSCQDIDECRLNVSGCAQECENTDGSFRCKCKPGFSLMADQKACEDINECLRNKSICTHRCVNTIGSYKCKCRRGYFLMEDQRSCDDEDECAVDKYGRRHAPCTHTCTNIPNGFMCSCPEGFVINMRNPATCIDVRNVVAKTPGAANIEQKSRKQ